MSLNGNRGQPLTPERLQDRHRQHIEAGFSEAAAVLADAQRRLTPAISRAADALYRCFASGGKVLVCGNGGSAADAQHFVGELVGRFISTDRAALPALALTADSAVLTAWSNDVGFEDVFARQVEAFGQPGDLLLVISTSGQSENLLNALEVAEERDLTRMALLGSGGGEARHNADLSVIVPSENSQRIQEVQILILHLLCELVEDRVLQRDGQRSTVGNSNGNAASATMED